MRTGHVPMKKGRFVNLKYALDFLGLKCNQWMLGRKDGVLPQSTILRKEYYEFTRGYDFDDILLIKKQITDKELRF